MKIAQKSFQMDENFEKKLALISHWMKIAQNLQNG
jgi:hypothetical protein